MIEEFHLDVAVASGLYSCSWVLFSTWNIPMWLLNICLWLPRCRNFIACDFGALFEDAGFQPATKYLASATKTLSFVKKASSAPPSSNLMDGAALDPSQFAGSPGLN